jgi:hypothetical protein
MFNSLTEKQFFCNTKPRFSFIFCNVAKKSFQKTSRLCEYDRFFAKSYSFVSFSVRARRTNLYSNQRRSEEKAHFTAFWGILPPLKNTHCTYSMPFRHLAFGPGMWYSKSGGVYFGYC